MIKSDLSWKRVCTDPNRECQKTNKIVREYGGTNFTTFERLIITDRADLARLIYEASPSVIHANHGAALILMLDVQGQAAASLASHVVNSEIGGHGDQRRHRRMIQRRPDPMARNGEATLMESAVLRGNMALFSPLFFNFLAFVRENAGRESHLGSWLDYSILREDQQAVTSIRGMAQHFRAMITHPAADLVRILVRGNFLASAITLANWTRATEELNENALAERILSEFGSLMNRQEVGRINALLDELPRLIIAPQARSNLQQGLIERVLFTSLGRPIIPRRIAPEVFSLILVNRLRTQMTSQQREAARTLAAANGQVEAARLLEENEASFLPEAKRRPQG